MNFKVTTNAKREIPADIIELVNLYTRRFVPHTSLDVEVVRRKPRDPDRKGYFGYVLGPFATHQGYDAHERELFHRQLKCIYFNIKPDKFGICRNVPKVFSGDGLDHEGRMRFRHWVVRFAAKNGCVIQDERR